jgi:hypothetical protein
MYVCIVCGEEKSLDSFGPRKTKLGHRKECKKCYAQKYKDYYSKNPDKYEKHKGYVKLNDKEYKRAHRRHHLTDEQFNYMIELYDGLCWSCQENLAQNIDHDHSCCPGPYSCGDCVRGLLCAGCNTAIGHVGDSVDRLQKLIVYLTN